MYNAEREFPFKDFLTKLILVIVFVFLLVWLLPKFITPTIVQENCNQTKKSGPNTECSLAYSSLTSQIFQDNLNKMKEAAVSYYTVERLPNAIGDTDKMTLADMYEKKLLTTLIDRNNKDVDSENSYVEITKMDEEYLLKVYIKDSEKEDYILVHLGCYNYCESYVCEKNSDYLVETGATKSSKASSYIEVSPSSYTTTTVVKGKKYKVKKYNKKSSNYITNTTVVNKYYKNVTNNYQTIINNYNEVNNNTINNNTTNNNTNNYTYNGGDVIIVINETCDQDDCIVTDNICRYDKKTKTYYGADGKVVTKEEFLKQCTEPDEPELPICKYDKEKNIYYGENGQEVSREQYLKECLGDETPICKYDKETKTYYGTEGTPVSKEQFLKDCYGVEPSPSPSTDPEPEQPICKYDKEKNIYYGENGQEVTKEEFIKQCTGPEDDKTYIWEYKKVTGATYSEWTKWSNWEKTSCDTQEINCSDDNPSCTNKLQMYENKEKIGTYKDTFTKQRNELRLLSNYNQKTCSKFDYVILDNITYTVKDVTKYTKYEDIKTTTTTQSAGSWSYVGTSAYSNPPSDSASTRYKFVGADYSYCTTVCTTLPKFFYAKYNYTENDLSKTTSTTSTYEIDKAKTTSTDKDVETVVKASCGDYTTKNVPIYKTVTVTDLDTIEKDLYGTVCYKSTKSRDVISEGKTEYKWSVENDETLLNNGWVLTGNKKLVE
jgi:hypothetical protein